MTVKVVGSDATRAHHCGDVHSVRLRTGRAGSTVMAVSGPRE